MDNVNEEAVTVSAFTIEGAVPRFSFDDGEASVAVDDDVDTVMVPPRMEEAVAQSPISDLATRLGGPSR